MAKYEAMFKISMIWRMVWFYSVVTEQHYWLNSCTHSFNPCVVTSLDRGLIILYSNSSISYRLYYIYYIIQSTYSLLFQIKFFL
jgi:hypothetical protein